MSAAKSNSDDLLALAQLTADVSSVDAATWEELREFQATYGKSLKDSLGKPAKGVYDTSGLLQKLAEIKMGGEFAPLPWIERVDHVSVNTLEAKLGAQVQDEFARESAFVDQALDAAQACYERLEELGVPYKRPDDYYAEMLKTDTHMAKIRRHLLAQQKRIEVVEERKKKRDLKKFGKDVQKQKEKAREEGKKSQLDAIKKWRKFGKPNDSISDDQFLVSIESSAKQGSSGKRGREAEPAMSYKQLKKQRVPNPRRQAKNAKYGFGGQKRGKKSNDAESSRAVADWTSSKRSSAPKGKAPARSGKPAGRGGPNKRR